MQMSKKFIITQGWFVGDDDLTGALHVL